MAEKKKIKNENSGQVPLPIADTGPDKKPSEAADRVENRKLKITRDVEGIFNKFESESDQDKKFPGIIEDPIDIKIELGNDKKVGPDENNIDQKTDTDEGKQKPIRRIYVVGGILIVLVAAITFFIFKTDEKRLRPEPSKTLTAQKISRPPLKPPTKSPKRKTVSRVKQDTTISKIEQDTPVSKVKQDTTVSKIEQATKQADEIKAFLAKWKTAWENTAGKQGDIETFMFFYADDFVSKGMNKSEWRNDKTQKNRRKGWIRLELKDINIADPVANDQAEVNFLQIFKSSNYSDETHQTLVLKKDATGWKITGIKTVE
jgi:ketosteroid isomerase-like protein